MGEFYAFFYFFFLLSWIHISAKTFEDWRTRNIYQVLPDRFAPDKFPANECTTLRDYCGGTLSGLQENLDYIQGMGFNAIWISAFVVQTYHPEYGTGYHGYWMGDMDNINSNFGDETTLINFITECHKRDILVMLDVVANHMGYSAPELKGETNLSFSDIYPFNQSIYYHTNCTPQQLMLTEPGNYSYINDYGIPYNQTLIEICRCGDLPDLDQDNAFVQEYLLNWIHKMIEYYEIDGLRIDTVPYVSKTFWTAYFLSANNAYSLSEIKSHNATYVASYQIEVQLDPLNYPLYYAISAVFGLNKDERSPPSLLNSTIHENRQFFNDTLRLGNFIDNHDVPRFLRAKQDLTSLKNALVFLFFTEGVPILYYGTEQNFDGFVNYSNQYTDPDSGEQVFEDCLKGSGDDPCNRQSMWPYFNIQSSMYTYMSLILKYRNYLAVNSKNFFFYLQKEGLITDNFYSFWRDETFIAVTNCGSDENQITDLTILSSQHPFPPDTTLTDALGGNNVIVKSDGSMILSMTNNLPRVLYIAS